MLKRFLLVCACVLALLLCISFPAAAQSPQKGLDRGLTLELSGGFAHTNFHAKTFPDVNGVVLAAGLNITNWLEVSADWSGQFASVTGGNTRIYGDHFGARLFLRRSYLPFSPFGEALFGSSRLDLNLNGPPKQNFSEHGFSYKLGGGLDVPLTRHWTWRLANVDYYRTKFLKAHQNNIWFASTLTYTFGRFRFPK